MTTPTTIIATTAPTTIELYLAVNQDGDFQVSSESVDDAVGELQGNFTCNAVRVVTINVTVDLPIPETVNVAITVPAETKAPAQVAVS